MQEPVLFAHRIGHRLYELSGLRTTSVRDQMVRASFVVKRLISNNQIGAGAPLLIIGGGAGGIVAGMQAANYGVPAVLLEKTNNPFSTQQQSDRWLDPSEYDWPAKHWDCESYPAPAHAIALAPLPWSTDRAKVLATRWETTFRRFVASSAHIDVRYNTTVDRTDVFDGPHEVTYHSPTGPAEHFGAAISFVGFPRERIRVASGRPGQEYRGYGFWEPDGVVHAAQRGKSVLVSGGGDGALQDFIRVSTGGKRARDVLEAFDPNGKLDLVRLMQSEDVAQRACLWSRADNCSVLNDWHLEYAEEADRLFGALKHPKQAAQQLDLVAADVQLVHKCRHFGYCYPLNRIAVLLLARLHAHVRRIPVNKVIVEGHSVETVAPQLPNVSCQGPGQCERHPHVIDVKPEDCTGSGPPQSPHPLTADIVIVRHGVERDPLFGPPPMPRQLTSYYAY